jgi:hypothetical protein
MFASGLASSRIIGGVTCCTLAGACIERAREKSIKPAVVRGQGRDRALPNRSKLSQHQEIPMKIRSTILSLAALATLSVSALAPTKASAWGMHGGYGGGYHHFGGYGGYHHFGGYGGYHNWGSYGGGYRHVWSGYRPYWRPHYRPSYGSYPTYVAPAYAPAPVAAPCECEAPAPTTYVAPAPVQQPCECEAPAPIVKRVYVPVQVPVPVRVEVPVPVRVPVPVAVPVVQQAAPCSCEAPAPTAYVPPPAPAATPCNCEAPAAPTSYSQAPQVAQTAAPSQDHRPVNYASTELQKD